VANGQSREQRPSVLWWCYLALYAALFCLTFVNFVSEGLFESFGAAFLSWAILSSDAVCIIGLYAYIRSTRLFAPAFWRVMLMLLVARMFVSASFLVPNLFPWKSTPEQYVALAGLVSFLLAMPLLVALWRYGYRSPHIWRNTPSPAAPAGVGSA
jgi:hypothetical protein